MFNVVPEVSEIVVTSFYSFFLSSASQQLFLPIYFQLTYPVFSLSFSTTGSFLSLFHFSYCVVHHCLFFSSSRFLLNSSSIISIHDSILLPRSWIIFIITTLNSFSDRLPISFLFIWNCRFLPWSFDYYIFLSCLSGLLFIVFRVVVPLVSTVWYLMGEICPGASTGFLLGGTGACTLVNGTEIFISDGHACVRWCAVGVYELSMNLGSLLGDAWGCVPCLAGCLVWGVQHWSFDIPFTDCPMCPPSTPPKVPFCLIWFPHHEEAFLSVGISPYHKALARGVGPFYDFSYFFSFFHPICFTRGFFLPLRCLQIFH